MVSWLVHTYQVIIIMQLKIYSSVQSLSRVWLCHPMDCSTPGFPVHHQLPEFPQTHIESVMPSKYLIFCLPLLNLSQPSIFPSIRVFSSEAVLCIRWPKYWSISISLSQEYSGFISYRIDWFVLLTVQGILMSLLQHNLKAILQLNSDNNRDFNTPFSTTFLSRSPR